MGSVDHWLALLVLGACQSLGRTKDEQHRSFLELAHREGWWKVFKASEEPNDWMGVLRCWQDGALDKLTYPYWMSLFPTIYQLSRYRDVYVRLLKSAGRRPEDMYQVARLLAPRIDEALTGAGTRFRCPARSSQYGYSLGASGARASGKLWRANICSQTAGYQSEQVSPIAWRRLASVDKPDDGMSNSQKARDYIQISGVRVGDGNPKSSSCVRYTTSAHLASNDVNLRLQFGLE